MFTLAIAPILLFIAFLLLLLVSLSVPIIKTIYLFKVTAFAHESIIKATADASANFGVWGYCVSAISSSVLGITRTEPAECSKAKLGYTFDSNVESALHVSGLTNKLSSSLTAALVLHPLACGFAFLALLTSISVLHPRIRHPHPRLHYLLTFSTALIAALLATIVFLIDVISIGVLHSTLKADISGDTLSTSYGNAVWMTLGAAIALWGACAGACCGIVLGRRAARNSEKGPANY